MASSVVTILHVMLLHLNAYVSEDDRMVFSISIFSNIPSVWSSQRLSKNIIYLLKKWNYPVDFLLKVG